MSHTKKRYRSEEISPPHTSIVDEIFLSTIEIVEVVEVIVEVMGVVEVMEVTLLFVEVISLQKSKSLRVAPHRFFYH